MGVLEDYADVIDAIRQEHQPTQVKTFADKIRWAILALAQEVASLEDALKEALKEERDERT